MNEFKGTLGKWSFSHGSASDDNVACIEINSSESLHEIAYLQSTPASIGKYEQTSFDKTIANAHLIAAAPDLLEALQLALNAMNEMGDILNFHDLAEQSKVDELTPAFEKSRAAISKALGEH
ncbi:hypothetical protein LZP96_09535 [Enterobacteriaceae bacterium 155047]|uniref:hypothetical protein n=1 Tax=Huaxiibacter chinensis TaxID=2899785 RepID=UPI00216495DD|nr:hypothetical protein [Huaxiibacter chinensis]MCG5044279.1 hypothetical protein [Huaxiibacter chinensis]